MKPFRSIRWRLQVWYGLLFAAVLVGLAVLAYYFERSKRLELLDDELQARVMQLQATVRGVPARPPPPNAPGGQPPPNRGRGWNLPAGLALSEADVARGNYLAVWTHNGPPLTKSANAPAALTVPTATSGVGVREHGEFREIYLNPNPGDFLLVGRSQADDLGALRAFAWRLSVGSVALLALVLLIGWWLTGRALRPIRDIGDTAAKIATGDLAQRINSRDTESELGQLANILNSTFARLEAAFAQQGRFTADAAHELRTPVTVILTHVQNTLAGDQLADDQREALEACQRAAQRMRRIIESLLQLARIDAGEEPIRRAPLDLAAVGRECVELVGPLAAQRRVAVTTALAPTLVQGDHDRLAQVLVNLLTNAVHHNREDGEIHLATRAEDGTAIVTVADRGPGIAAEHLPHVFKRFYRADKARTTHAGRTGLGLAIAKAIVDAHGGSIEAANAGEGGAVFTVRLPAH